MATPHLSLEVRSAGASRYLQADHKNKVFCRNPMNMMGKSKGRVN